MIYMQNLVGLVLPFLIDIINSRIEEAKVRFAVSLLVCVVVGVLLNLDKLNRPEDLLGSIAIIFSTAQATYKLYWEKSAPREKVLDGLNAVNK